MVAPQMIAGLAGAGAGILQGGMGFFGKYNKSSRRAAKKQAQLEKARAVAAREQTQREIAMREAEEPREISALKSSFAARRFSPKSSMYGEDMSRLARIQASQMASLRDQANLQTMGLSLLKRQARLKRRLAPLQMYSDYLGIFSGADKALGGMPAPEGPTAGQVMENYPSGYIP